MPLGPNLEARVTYFENKMVTLRNKFFHRVPRLNAYSSQITFNTSATLLPQPTRPSRQETISTEKLFEEGEWLNWFAAELADALTHSALTGKFEIDHPKSTVPQAQNQSHPPKAPHTIRGKPRRTRRRSFFSEQENVIIGRH